MALFFDWMSRMETQERISLFKEFIETSYKEQLINRIKKDERFLVLDFRDLIAFNSSLAEDLLDDTRETITAASIAIEQLDTLGDVKNFRARFEHLSKSTYKDIWKIRSGDVDKLITIKGYLRRVGDVQHKVSCGTFECDSCGNITNILQFGTVWRKPDKCGCGGRKLRLISRELKDVQKIVVEEDPLALSTPTQKPRSIMVMLEDDLTREEIDSTLQPSRKISISGIVKDRPVKSESTEYRKFLEAHSLDIVNDTIENIKISKEDIEKFKKMSQSETLFEDLAQSVVPNIDGHMTARIAIVLQLVGGTPLYFDGVLEERGQIHILLIGSPGCYSKDTLITKSDGTFIRGHKLYEEQAIKKVRIGRIYSSDPHNSDIIRHFKYPSVPVKVIKTVSKELTCSYNHPLLVKFSNGKKWVKASEIMQGDKIRVVTHINCIKKDYLNMGGYIINEDFGLMLGFFTADATFRKYEVSAYFNEDELDVLDKVAKILDSINLKSHICKREHGKGFIDDRKICRVQQIKVLSVYNKKFASVCHMDKQPMRKVPDIILESKKSIVASYLAGLFEGDGSISLMKRVGRIDRPRITLKSSSHQLLLDTQVLLLKFGIEARISSDNLTISKAKDIFTFYSEIRFISKRKQARLKRFLKLIKNQHMHQRKKLYQEVISIEEGKPQDVFDIEVNKYHRLLTNGIISHNSGKSVMLKRAILFLPGSRFTGGKGSSGVGLVAAVTKDEEMGGYSLSAGAVAMSSGALCAIDEIDKMSKTDIAHMNNAMVDMKVNIDKADIHGTLETNTAILAAANPKDRVFDPHDLIWKQIGLPKDHLDRYDLIFPVIAPKSPELQKKIANLVVGKYIPDSKLAKPKYPMDVIVKYFAYAKQFKPQITEEVKDYIVENFLNLIKPADTKEDAAYFSARLLTNIIRLTQAVTRTRLSNKMIKEDAQRAINILIDSLKMQEIITTNNLFDYERAEAITPKKKRDIALIIKKIVRDLMPLDEKEGLADYDDILKKALENEIEDVDLLDETIEKLKRVSDLIEVRRNKYKAQ